MNDPEVKFSGAPKLGYASHQQIFEFVNDRNITSSPSNNQRLATRLWYSVLRLGGFRADADENGLVYNSWGLTIEIGKIALDTDGNVKPRPDTLDVMQPEGVGDVINADTLSYLLESGELERIEQIGEKTISLAQEFIDCRKAFLS